jgi:hypothetical protein
MPESKPVPGRAVRLESDLRSREDSGLDMSKLSDYLQTQKIDPRRILATSHELEASRPEDRKTRLAKRRAKGADEKAKEAAKEAAAIKPRSGKPLSRPLLDRALAGGTLSGAAKTRILRALNALLTTKKKSEANLRDVF